MGSASETEYLLLLANELGLLNGDTHRKLSTDTAEVKRMLAALIAKLKADR
jgi:four helix bundle protein